MSRTIIHEVPEGMRIKVVHLHEGNSSSRLRKGKKYRTIARLIDNEDRVVSEGEALCGPRDVPSKQLGREIATGRCLVAYNISH